MKHFQLFKHINSSERYFLFTDGSTRKESNPPVIGLGAELRDVNGALVLTYSEEILIKNLPEDISPDASEKLALIQALKICLNENIQKIVINTDSSGLSSKLNSFLEAKFNQLPDYFNFLHSVTENHLNKHIFKLSEEFNEIFIEYIPRKLNKNADFYSRSTGLLIKNHALNHYSQTTPLNIHQYSKNQTQIIKNINNKLGANSTISPKELEQSKVVTENISYVKEKRRTTNNKNLPSIEKIIKDFNQTKINLSVSDIKNFDNFYIHRNDEKILNLDIQEYPTNLSIRFFYGDHHEKNINEFKSISIDKNGQNIYLPLLFVIYNLMTESSGVDLKHAFDPLDKRYNFIYSHKLWKTLDIENKSYLKTRAFIQKTFFSNFKKFISSVFHLDRNLGEYYSNFLDIITNNNTKLVLHHTTSNQRLYMDDESIAAANEASALLNQQNLLKNKSC